MGMFDHVIVEDLSILPVSDSDRELIRTSVEKNSFQTKDFENCLTEIYITKEGRLMINQWNLEEVPKEERPFPDASEDDIRSVFGSIRRVNERLEEHNFHGIFSFYTSLDRKEWFEFRAKFTDGNLVEVVRINEHEITTEDCVDDDKK